MPRTRDATTWRYLAVACARVYAWAGADGEAVGLLDEVSRATPGVGPAQVTRDPLYSLPLARSAGYSALLERLDSEITSFRGNNRGPERNHLSAIDLRGACRLTLFGLGQAFGKDAMHERARRRGRPCSGVVCGLLLALTLAPGASPAADSPLDLQAHRGKVVVVDFWASWCVPCRRSFPWLNAMRKKYQDQGLVIVGVNVDRERTDADAFLAATPAEFTIVYDAEGRLPKEYGVMGMPSSFIFDRQGRLVTRHLGFQNGKRDEYEQVLRNALNGRTE